MEKSNSLIDPFHKGIIVGLWLSGSNYTNIHKTLRDINIVCSYNTVRNICEKFENNHNCDNNYDKCGRPKILTKNNEQKLISYIEQHPNSSRKQLCESKQANPKRVTGQTLVNSLKRQGYKRLVVPKTILLTPIMIEQRINWCKSKLLNQKRVLQNTIYTDESWLAYDSIHKKYIWVKENTKIEYDDKQKVKKWPSKIMVWAAIHKSGPLYIHLVDGSFTSKLYLQILNKFYFDEGHIRLKDSYFQQDNARPHKTQEILQFFKKNNILILDWPVNSPDLSPIEKVWFVLKDIINKEIDQIDTFLEFQKRITYHFYKNNQIKSCIKNSIEKVPEVLTNTLLNKGYPL